MENIEIEGLNFEILLSSEKILHRVSSLAEKIKQQYQPDWPLFLIVLNGASIFASDLLKSINTSVPTSLVKVSSYSGTESTKNISVDYFPYEMVRGKNILLIEDIVDTGLTLTFLKKELKKHGANKIECVTLFFKPSKYNYSTNPQYVGFNIGEDFIVGYGMDYNQKGRDLNHVYKTTTHQN